MIEMLIVLALLGVVLAFVAPRIGKYLGKSQEAEMKFKFAGIKEALNEYRMEFGAYPDSRQGLRALVENPLPNNERYARAASKWPFLKEENITDKAGNEIIYNCPPERFKNKYKQFELIYEKSENDPDAFDDGF